MSRVHARRLQPPVLAASIVALLAACGSGGGGTATNSSTLPPSTSSSSSSSSSSAGTPTPTAAPTASSVAATVVVWVVSTGSGQLVRTVPLGGGSGHTVATLPADAVLLAAGAGRLAAVYADHSIHVISLGAGTARAYTVAAASGDVVFPGAFTPDGTHLLYVHAFAGGSGGALRSLDLAAGTYTTVVSYPHNTYDLPRVDTDAGLAASQLIGFADVGEGPVSRLNPATGARTATTDLAGGSGAVLALDALHGADSTHTTGLGDDGDSPGGPGPQQPFNTLLTFTIGSAAVSAFAPEPHHSIHPLGVAGDGTVYYWDDSAPGGFAGITQSPDFGLFVLPAGGSRSQIRKYGDHWGGGTVAPSGTFFVADDSNTRLYEYVGSSLVQVDTVAGESGTVLVATA